MTAALIALAAWGLLTAVLMAVGLFATRWEEPEA